MRLSPLRENGTSSSLRIAVIDTVFLAAGIPLILIVALLPPALLGAKIFALYDSIPPEIKDRYKLSSDTPSNPSTEALLFMLTMIAFWQFEGLQFIQPVISFLIMIGSTWYCLSRTRFYLSIVPAGNEMP